MEVVHESQGVTESLVEPIEAWGPLSRRFGYFYGSSVVLEMGFGES